ncbi:uncharacterized protein LOC116545830 [Sapajus apella]|uniref:Uncharacterized protein LOC116545830 n=1 Tax=Sapajus apella TaxID=9515 RepID=A0A6J3HCB0_SAPAP|nr:uncharacterized protein LOC116545830 [Sapajus apella]
MRPGELPWGDSLSCRMGPSEVAIPEAGRSAAAVARWEPRFHRLYPQDRIPAAPLPAGPGRASGICVLPRSPGILGPLLPASELQHRVSSERPAPRTTVRVHPPALPTVPAPGPGCAGPCARPARTHHLCIPSLSAAPCLREAFTALVTQERVRERERFRAGVTQARVNAHAPGRGGPARLPYAASGTRPGLLRCRRYVLLRAGSLRSSASRTERAATRQNRSALQPSPPARPGQALSASRILSC